MAAGWAAAAAAAAMAAAMAAARDWAGRAAEKSCGTIAGKMRGAGEPHWWCKAGFPLLDCSRGSSPGLPGCMQCIAAEQLPSP